MLSTYLSLQDVEVLLLGQDQLLCCLRLLGLLRMPHHRLRQHWRHRVLRRLPFLLCPTLSGLLSPLARVSVCGRRLIRRRSQVFSATEAMGTGQEATAAALHGEAGDGLGRGERAFAAEDRGSSSLCVVEGLGDRRAAHLTKRETKDKTIILQG